MKIKAVLLAFLAVALGAQARVVTEAEALRVAVALDGAAGGSVTAAQTPDGALYYAVKRPGGGSVILSGETRVEPLLAFSPSDEVVLDAKSPLAALVAADLSVRWPSATRLTAAGTSAAKPTAAEEKWAALLAKGERLAATPENPVKKESYLDDPRVSPLVETRWDQGQVLAKEGDRIVKANCYNFYTPEYTYVDHTTGKTCTKRCVCGCIATAMAQILRYWKQPSGVQPSFSGTCTMPDKVTWSETLGRYTSTTKTVLLMTQPGPYVWSWMVEVPGPDTLYPGSLDEIGKLTYACGISVGMDYDIEDEGGSGILTSEVSRIPKAIRERFGYANAALTGWSAGKNNAILASLDAECPVLLCVKGPTEGHAVVADGYGFKDETRYVHLNMGWSGQLDLWYNLPEIPLDDNPESFDKFDEVVSIIYNVNPHKAREYVTGRVLDEDGKPVYDACVTLRVVGDPYGSDVAYSNERGIYCLEAESGKAYTIVATTDKYCSDVVTTPVLSNSQAGSAVGNIWGNELVLHNPSVQLNGGSALFSTLDAALAVATDDDEIEIIAPTELRADAVVNCPCRIVSLDPSVATVTRVGGARLTVASGARLELSDVTFTGAATTLVEVEAGGCLAVGSGVCFGVAETVAAVVTQDAAGFELALGPEDDPIGELAESFALDCVAATGLNQTFGFATCHPDVAAAQAGRIVNVRDATGEIAGKADGDTPPVALKWGTVPVSPEDAAAYYVADGTVETNAFRRLDRLFEALALADVPATVTVLKDGTLGRRITLSQNLTIVSPEGATLSYLAESAGFTVPAGCTLTVDGLNFTGMTGDSLFIVNGGELVLKGDVTVADFTGTKELSSAAVRVTAGGRVTIGSVSGAVVFDNCRNETSGQSTGGAIYAAGSGTVVVLQDDVAITGCFCRGTGGGVYVGKNALLRLAGALTIDQNVSGASELASDVYCASGSRGIELFDEVVPGSLVGVRAVRSGWNTAGYAFAQIGAELTDKVKIYDSAKAFFCDDAAPELHAEPTADYSALCWAAKEEGIKPVDPEVATVHIAGTVDGYYDSLADALTVLGGDGTIEILRDMTISAAVEISANITLKSAAGGPFTLTRADQCEIRVGATGALTVENLTLTGGSARGRLLMVDGGELTLGKGASVRDVTGGTVRTDSAVHVANGGCLTLLDGAVILDCENPYTTDYSQNGRGGAVSADVGSRVRLLGGTIENCAARTGGGVFVGTQSAIEIGGGVEVANNGFAGKPGNVYVPEKCELTLVSPLTGRVGVTQGLSADPYVFGRVADGFAGTDAQLDASAARFSNDLNGDVGRAVRKGAVTLLVWSDGLALDGSYTDAEGTVYSLVAGAAPLKTALPAALPDLVYTGVEQVGLDLGHGYVVSGERATDAGDYEATMTLKAGFVWDDGETAQMRTVAWSIGKATYDMSAVVFNDATFTYDGQPKSLEIVGTLPQGVTVTYVGNGVSAIGSHVVTAKFEGDAKNYNAIPDKTATLTIIEPGPGPQPVPCPPFAFTSIVRNAAETGWILTIAPVAETCTYTLWTSDDLATWTSVGEPVVAGEDGSLTFEAIVADDARFWKVVGQDGLK